MGVEETVVLMGGMVVEVSVMAAMVMVVMVMVKTLVMTEVVMGVDVVAEEAVVVMVEVATVCGRQGTLERNVMLRCWQQSRKSILISAWFVEGFAEEQSDLHCVTWVCLWVGAHLAS